jgi:phage terminase large subunit
MANETTIQFNFESKFFTDVFRKLWRQNNGKRYVVNYGGSGSSKSHSQAQLEALVRLKTPGVTVVGRKVARTHKDSTVALLTTIFKDLQVFNKEVIFAKYDREFRISNGSKIIFVGLDDIEKLKSIHRPQRFWLEEATECTVEDFNEIDRRLRGVDDIQLSLTFNPIDVECWIRQYFWDTPYFADPSRTVIIKSTYKDNHYLNTHDIERAEAMKLYNENDYRIYTLGEWGQLRTGHEFYFKFSMKDHIGNYLLNKDDPIHISFDFNVVPYICCSIWQVVKIFEKYEARCIDEITLKDPENNTFDLCKEVMRKYGKHRSVFLYGDATGRARKTESREHNWQIIIRQLAPMLNNCSDRVPASNPSVARRREFINRAFHGSLVFEIKIDQSCRLMIEDLIRVKADATGIKLKVHTKELGVTFERWGHLSDTLDYFICKLFENLFNNF